MAALLFIISIFVWQLPRRKGIRTFPSLNLLSRLTSGFIFVYCNKLLFMKLFEWIAGLFSDIKRIFKSIPQEVAEHATESLKWTKWLRAAFDNPITRAVLNTIPGAADDIAVAAAVRLLDKVIPYLEILDTCNDVEDPFERVACWANALAKLPKHTQDAYLAKLASLLTAEKDGNRLKQSLYDFYTQATYIAKYK